MFKGNSLFAQIVKLVDRAGFQRIVSKYDKFLSVFDWSLSNLIALLRPNLFTYRDLYAWLNNPFETPPEIPYDEQLVLPFA